MSTADMSVVGLLVVCPPSPWVDIALKVTTSNAGGLVPHGSYENPELAFQPIPRFTSGKECVWLGTECTWRKSLVLDPPAVALNEAPETRNLLSIEDSRVYPAGQEVLVHKMMAPVGTRRFASSVILDVVTGVLRLSATPARMASGTLVIC